ncbi:hypothetical protein [Alteribacillus persepolensis]|nr:hypothetical protein [Alteribacillus persepolensis]
MRGLGKETHYKIWFIGWKNRRKISPFVELVCGGRRGYKMGFRFDMQNKSSQQQAIVRKRDEADKRRREESQKKKDGSRQELKWEVSPRLSDYEGIFVKDGEKYLFELRVSRTTLFNEPCGLNEKNVHDWLFEVSNAFAEEVKEYKIFCITSSDVRDGELTTDWKNLRVETK